MNNIHVVLLLHGAPLGIGGLGIQSLNAVHDVLEGGANTVVTIGPSLYGSNQFDKILPRGTVTIELQPRQSILPHRYSWLRWLHGRRQYLDDVSIGKQAVRHLNNCRPSVVYGFTQVSLEAFICAKKVGIPTILESPNGHIRFFREIYKKESARHYGWAYLGHPTHSMVSRVEKEYELATMIRVSSNWACSSLIKGGVSANKIIVVPQIPRFSRFFPLSTNKERKGPLRVSFVGTLDLRKGFVYLLRAVKILGSDRVKVRLIGGTVDRFTASLLRRESFGLDVIACPDDPLPTLHWSEIFVLPTLEDGSPFAVLEAMAAGVPVIVTTECGNHDLVCSGRNGWVIPAGNCQAMADMLSNAITHRNKLSEMGEHARIDWEQLHKGNNVVSMNQLFNKVVSNFNRIQ